MTRRRFTELTRRLAAGCDDPGPWLEACRLSARFASPAELAALAPGPGLRDRLWVEATREVALIPDVLPLYGLLVPVRGPAPPGRWWDGHYRLGDAGSFYFDRRTGFPLEVERIADGGRMVLVPAGPTVTMQAEDGKLVPRRRTRSVSAFLVDVHPVTAGQYAAFLDATPLAHIPPREWDRQRARPRRPVVFVTHRDAAAYAAWAGAKLLGLLGWEKAARGSGAAVVPWPAAAGGGPARRANLADRARDGRGVAAGWDSRLVEVGLYPDGASPYGAQDMAGNVREWVGEGHYWRELACQAAGSSWRTPVTAPLLGVTSDPAETRADDLGFRLGRPLSSLVRSIDRLRRDG